MNDHAAVEHEGYDSERRDHRASEVPSSVGHFRPREKQERGSGQERGCEFAREDAQDREREQGRLAVAPRDSTDLGQGQEEEAEAQGVLVNVPGESKGDEVEGRHSDEQNGFLSVPSQSPAAEDIEGEAEETIQDRGRGFRDRKGGAIRRDGDEPQQGIDERCGLDIQDPLDGWDESFGLDILHERRVNPDGVETEGPRAGEDLGNRADGEREDERQEEVPVRGTPPSKGPQELNGPVERPSRAIDHRRHHLVVPEDATILRGTRSRTSTEWFIPTPP